MAINVKGQGLLRPLRPPKKKFYFRSDPIWSLRTWWGLVCCFSSILCHMERISYILYLDPMLSLYKAMVLLDPWDSPKSVTFGPTRYDHFVGSRMLFFVDFTSYGAFLGLNSIFETPYDHKWKTTPHTPETPRNEFYLRSDPIWQLRGV